MTLSQWLRDYLYIPLGGNRHGALRTALALFMTMALGGLWHGAGWTFVLWGVAHGTALILVRFLGFKVPAVIGTALTFLFVMLTWIVFRSETLGSAVQHYAALLTPSHFALTAERLAQISAVALAGLLCFTAPNSQRIALWLAARHVRAVTLSELPALAALVLILAIAFISPDTASAFIYFQF
jgi:D-alanyl-lipoteichoic acid acyltransferase DltB (MBOAT superfamily)